MNLLSLQRYNFENCFRHPVNALRAPYSASTVRRLSCWVFLLEPEETLAVGLPAIVPAARLQGAFQSSSCGTFPDTVGARAADCHRTVWGKECCLSAQCRAERPHWTPIRRSVLARTRVRAHTERKRGSFYREAAHTEDKVQEYLNKGSSECEGKTAFYGFYLFEIGEKCHNHRNASVPNTVFSLVRLELLQLLHCFLITVFHTGSFPSRAQKQLQLCPFCTCWTSILK